MDVIFPIDENENSAGVALLKLTIPFMDLNGPKPLTFYVINIYKNGMFIFTQNVRDAIQDDKSYGSKEKLRAKVWLRKLRSKRFDDSFPSFLKTANSDGQTLSMKNFINCQKVLEDEGVIIVENDPNPNMVSLSDLTTWRSDNTTLKINEYQERWNKGSYLDILISKLSELKKQIETDDPEEDFD